MRVLIVSSSTGGGHDMRANAFEAWAQRLPELNITTDIYRPLDSGPPLHRFGVHLYNWIQRRAPFLHHIYFNFLELVRPVGSARRLLGAKKFREVLAAARPDVLLSVHGSLNHGFFEVARAVLGRVRCVTYCGELHGGYGFSRNWVNPAADLFIGAVEETCEAAIDLGMPQEKTKLGGFLLRPEFYEERPNERSNGNGLSVLLSASSRGANNHVAFLHALQRAQLETEIVVLCGKSQRTHAAVEEWSRANPAARVRIVPHDTNVAALLHSVTAVVARPGTGATSEAIMCGCPLLLNCLGGIMPQEWITVKFCRKHHLAQTLHRADDLVRCLKNAAALAAMRENMERVCPTMTPRDILRLVTQ